MKKVTVSAAIILNNNEILCVQRSKNKYPYISEKFEFPGGKIEAGESEKEALMREIKEELNLVIKIERKFLVVHHQYPDFQLEMHSYLCTCSKRDLTLHEHIAEKWLAISNLEALDWAAADVPIVHKLVQEYNGNTPFTF